MRKKTKNMNHPKKGSTIKVQPITRVEDIRAIKAMLATRPRDLALFVVGINTNLRAGDLVSLKVSQVKSLKAGGDFEIKEEKTSKTRRITLNKDCVSVIQNLLASRPYKENDYLFQGQRGTNHITPIYLNHLVKKWCSAINLKGNYGSHTLRKTFGYHQRVTFHVDIPTLMEIFNHSTQKQTLDYLCVQPEEIVSVYKNVIG